MKLSVLLLSAAVLLPPVSALQAAPREREARIENLDGRAALSHLASLRQRRAKAFETSVRRMEARGYRPTNVVAVVRTQGETPLIQESYSNSEGEIVLWSWDDGDPSTWEGVIYAEDYTTGTWATHDTQVDVTTDQFFVLWEQKTSSGGGGGRELPEDWTPASGSSKKRQPRAVLASSSIQRVQHPIPLDTDVMEFFSCFAPKCGEAIRLCRFTGKYAVPCAVAGCTAAAIYCATEVW